MRGRRASRRSTARARAARAAARRRLARTCATSASTTRSTVAFAPRRARPAPTARPIEARVPPPPRGAVRLRRPRAAARGRSACTRRSSGPPERPAVAAAGGERATPASGAAAARLAPPTGVGSRRSRCIDGDRMAAGQTVAGPAIVERADDDRRSCPRRFDAHRRPPRQLRPRNDRDEGGRT